MSCHEGYRTCVGEEPGRKCLCCGMWVTDGEEP